MNAGGRRARFDCIDDALEENGQRQVEVLALADV